jgi:4,5-dihydroxyphthalate decarboxylase
MGKLTITIACRGYDRVRALIDGTVTVDGCETVVLPWKAEEIFLRAYNGAQFDVTELSMSSHLVTTAKGIARYVAIPVFVSRMFRHSAIYVRADRKIERPADLRGKTIGVPEYQMTAALWVRGMLSDEYGVRSEEMRWRTGGLEIPGRAEKFGLVVKPPFDVRPIPSGRTLNELLACGELDAVVSARPPSCFGVDTSAIRRLFPNYREAEERYFEKTGLFPIMHVIGIRRDLAARYPWLAGAVYRAFRRAQAACAAAMDDDNALEAMLPWFLHELAATKKIMGSDYWPYGIEANRAAIGAMIRYAHEQGLTERELSVEELFAVRSDEEAKV